MCRPFTLRAQIVDLAGDAPAVEQIPEPVDDHAGRERVVARCDPVGKIKPGGAVVNGLNRNELTHRSRNDRSHHCTTVIQPIAARKYMDRPWRSGNRHQALGHRIEQLLLFLFQ